MKLKDRLRKSLPVIMLTVHIFLIFAIWPLSVYLDSRNTDRWMDNQTIPPVDDMCMGPAGIALFLLGSVIMYVYIPTAWISTVVWGLRRLVNSEYPLSRIVVFLLGLFSIISVFFWLFIFGIHDQ